MVVMNYMKFARYQRIQSLKAIEYAFKDVSESRYCVYFFFHVEYVLGRGNEVLIFEVMNSPEIWHSVFTLFLQLCLGFTRELVT